MTKDILRILGDCCPLDFTKSPFIEVVAVDEAVEVPVEWRFVGRRTARDVGARTECRIDVVDRQAVDEQRIVGVAEGGDVTFRSPALAAP
jgi:hypothetical protein